MDSADAKTPLASVIVLTRDEEKHIGACLDALLAQSYPRVEVIVVDAASTDRTVEIAREYAERHGERVRLLASEERLTVGEARNRGVAASRGELVAFTSADALADRRWIDEAVEALGAADVVYGLQLHRPAAPTVGAVTRGLRYHHFFRGGTPEAFASNVNCVGRRALFLEFSFPEDEVASALDDVLFASEVARAGHRIAFSPRVIVSHVDVATLAQEFRKVRREAYGWGFLRPRLGPRRDILLWGAGLTASLLALVLFPGALTGLLAGAVAVAPAARRLLRRGRAYPPAKVAAAFAASVALDLLFLAYYLKGAAAAFVDARRAEGD